MALAQDQSNDTMSAEQALRIDMAAGFRWMDKVGMSDLTAGSPRDPLSR